jgi:hypothetical protein
VSRKHNVFFGFWAVIIDGTSILALKKRCSQIDNLYGRFEMPSVLDVAKQDQQFARGTIAPSQAGSIPFEAR